jgi:plasmid stabilization system protein ParE
MRKLVYTPEARQDLRDIRKYIASTLQNPVAAKNTVNRIRKDIWQLKDMPGIGPSLSSHIPFETKYRFLVCGNYTVFYYLDEDIIYIGRILYSKRDYVRALFNDVTDYEE